MSSETPHRSARAKRVVSQKISSAKTSERRNLAAEFRFSEAERVLRDDHPVEASRKQASSRVSGLDLGDHDVNADLNRMDTVTLH